MRTKELQKEIQRLMYEFPDSFINGEDELILVPKFNIYFRLEDVETINDLHKKVIAWLSRSCAKFNCYSQEWRNAKFEKEFRASINDFLETDFTNIQWDYIYCELGNNVNPELLNKFVESKFDFNIFNQEDYQKYRNLLIEERGQKETI